MTSCWRYGKRGSDQPSHHDGGIESAVGTGTRVTTYEWRFLLIVIGNDGLPERQKAKHSFTVAVLLKQHQKRQKKERKEGKKRHPISAAGKSGRTSVNDARGRGVAFPTHLVDENIA